MKVIKCPVCKLSTGSYSWPVVRPPRDIEELVKAGKMASEVLDEWLPYPLYQRSYSDNKKEYISPRCNKCYDKAEKKRVKNR